MTFRPGAPALVKTLTQERDDLKTQLAKTVAERDRLFEEIESVLRNMPQEHVVRVREGGGPEEIAASLAVSVSKLTNAWRDG